MSICTVASMPFAFSGLNLAGKTFSKNSLGVFASMDFYRSSSAWFKVM
jgi:hypothetical protein